MTDDPSDDDRVTWWNDRYGDADPVPWDTGTPKRALVDRVAAGEVTGPVVDVGCGTGTEALYLADEGYEVVGVDFSGEAIDRARERAADRSLDGDVTFRVADALALSETALGPFETAVDCGMLHTLADADRPAYTAELASVLSTGGRALFVEFGADAPTDWGPNPLSAAAVRRSFGDRWRVESVESGTFETRQAEVPGVVAVARRVA